MTYTVGQQLWYQPTQYGSARLVTITKIGRKWLTVGLGLHVDKETLSADGGEYMSPGQCYLSEADYHAKVNLDHQWAQLLRDIPRYTRPAHITIDQIKQVRCVLGLGNKEGV